MLCQVNKTLVTKKYNTYNQINDAAEAVMDQKQGTDTDNVLLIR